MQEIGSPEYVQFKHPVDIRSEFKRFLREACTHRYDAAYWQSVRMCEPKQGSTLTTHFTNMLEVLNYFTHDGGILTPIQRECLHLRYIQHKPDKEIARLKCLKRETIDRHIGQGIDAMIAEMFKQAKIEASR